uniref:Insulinoma-associated protein 2 n=1 Tax=Cavia porcellus TaxID=10141 RepID=H0W366_CAVPO
MPRVRHAERVLPPLGPQVAPPAPAEVPTQELSGLPCLEWRAENSEGPGPSRSPTKPAGAELRRAFLERCLSSPASAESFPGGTAALATFCSGGAGPGSPHSFPPALHGLKKLSFADEVTSSPVLGLKIKEEEPGAPSRALAGSRTPLGEFICQLCKEQYADPFALAQHRCSRIVRVEYRCPECDKVFSCPANLASHRRWHKPRPQAANSGKENSRAERTEDQHLQAKDSSREDQHQDSDPRLGLSGLPALELSVPPAPFTEGVLGRRVPGAGSASGGGGSEIFVCPYCHKKFRRQAYLRKHLGTHEAGSARALGPGFGSDRRAPLAFACPLCGAHFPSADIREKHRLWHAVREELLLPALSGAPPEAPGPGGASDGSAQQIFSCKHCPSTFFSSPGLTRHINKCHPSENRQVLLLQMPLRPGC